MGTAGRIVRALCATVVVTAAGCSIKLSPEPAEVTRASQAPVLRLGQVTEELTGTWAAAARANGWGGKHPLIHMLRQSEGASLLSRDRASLTMDIHLVSDHEHDDPRLFLLGCMSIATVGVIPLPFHSEWSTRCDVLIKDARGAAVAEYPLHVKGCYDIWAYPPTMFTLGAAGLRGPQDGAEVRRRMTTHLVADLQKAVGADYARLAKAKAANAQYLASVPGPAPPQGTAATPAPGGALFGPISRRWAVIVGVSSYKFRGKMGLGNLRYAARDAQALAAFLRSTQGGRFDHVVLLTDERATTRNVKAALREQLRSVQKNDFVLISWSGHGGPDPRERKRLYLITHDTDPAHVASTGYSMAELRTDMAKLEADKILVIADTCHSAGISDPELGIRGPEDNKIVDGFRGLHTVAGKGPGGAAPMRMIFTSCESGETSLESARLGGGHGVFTWFLLKALAGEADARPFGGNADGAVTLGEAIEFTRDQVKRFTQNQQHPDTAGRFDRRIRMSMPRRP